MMDNQERIVELVDDKGVELSSDQIRVELSDSNVRDVEVRIKHSRIDSESERIFDDDDDIPSDFFDDFSNQDFMAGLDVVDAWDDEEIDGKEREKKLDKSKELNNRNRHRVTERSRRNRSRSPIPARYDRRRYSRGRVRTSRDRYRTSRERYRTSREKNRASRERNRASRERNRSRDKHRIVKDTEPKKKSKDIKLDTQNEKQKIKPDNEEEMQLDSRRDPEKTKRDIQKDKDKCAKDKEAKIISEKLKVVETGLVPPGTELEVDLKQINPVVTKETNLKQVKEPENKGSAKSREEKHHGSRSKDVEIHIRTSDREKRYSPLRHRRSRSHELNYERKLSYRRSRSPYRGRSRSRSSLLRRISAERRMVAEERRRIRRYRDSSPTVLRRRTRDISIEMSPVSNISERELWLRKRSRGINISTSPISEVDVNHRKNRYFHEKFEDGLKSENKKRSYSPISDSESTNHKKGDFLEELANKLKSDKKKKSFLKEIQAQLNEPSKPQLNYAVPVSIPGPVPAPIPVQHPMQPMHGSRPGFGPGPSPYFPPQIDPAPQYDQQFFIGQPDMFHNSLYQQPFMDTTPGPEVMNMHGGPFSAVGVHNVTMEPESMNSPVNGANFSTHTNLVQAPISSNLQKDTEDLNKLFEDKKISLSDFLSMSAKHTDPTKPVNVQKKIKVISLCQDAIKALGGDSKLNGRFFLRKTYKEPEKCQEVKFQSPVRKIPIVRFNFTTPYKGGDEKSTLQNTLNKLLASLGLIEHPPQTISKSASSSSVPDTSVKSTFRRQTSIITASRKYDPIVGVKYQMKMCQTDPVKCHICDIRKARKFVDQGVQCEIDTVDSGTQITDDDLLRLGIKAPPKDVLKNQSLAHLTPAQLLARTCQEESPKKDVFSGSRLITPPPPPNMTPEKHRGLSNNDNFPKRSEYHDRYNPDSYRSQNNPNRPGAPSIFDKMIPNPFENQRSSNPFEYSNKGRHNSFEGASSRPNMFDNRSNQMHQERISNYEPPVQDRFGPGFSPRKQHEDNFEPPPNPRQFSPPTRSNFNPVPYGGRKYF